MGQMGLIVLGIFAVTDLGLDGAVLHSVSHGLVSAGLFLLAANGLRIASGAIAVPGGSGAVPVWQDLVGKPVGNPAEFIRAHLG